MAASCPSVTLLHPPPPTEPRPNSPVLTLFSGLTHLFPLGHFRWLVQVTGPGWAPACSNLCSPAPRELWLAGQLLHVCGSPAVPTERSRAPPPPGPCLPLPVRMTSTFFLPPASLSHSLLTCGMLSPHPPPPFHTHIPSIFLFPRSEHVPSGLETCSALLMPPSPHFPGSDRLSTVPLIIYHTFP